MRWWIVGILLVAASPLGAASQLTWANWAEFEMGVAGVQMRWRSSDGLIRDASWPDCVVHDPHVGIGDCTGVTMETLVSPTPGVHRFRFEAYYMSPVGLSGLGLTIDLHPGDNVTVERDRWVGHAVIVRDTSSFIGSTRVRSWTGPAGASSGFI